MDMPAVSLAFLKGNPGFLLASLSALCVCLLTCYQVFLLSVGGKMLAERERMMRSRFHESFIDI